MPNIFETLLNKQSAGKRTADLNDILNGQRQDQYLGRNELFGTGGGSPGLYSNIKDPALNNQNRLLQYLYGNGTDGGAFGNLNDIIGQIYNPSAVSGAYGGSDPYGQNTPGLQEILKQLQGVIPQLQGQSSLANQVFSGGGWTPQSQDSFDALNPIIKGQSNTQQAQTGMGGNIFASGGQNLNPMFSMYADAAKRGMSGTNPLLDFASNGAQKIFGQGGQTADTNAGIGAAKNMFGNGGMTGPLNSLVGAGNSALSYNGLTPTGMQGETAALKTINEGGSTPTTNALQSTGTNLFSQPSLLPTNQVTSMARNEAGTGFQNNMEAARRQAFARGGGPGSNVASGLTNQSLADYSDAGAANQASAVQKALTDQQGLKLQQAGMGANMAQAGGALENNRFGTASTSLNNLEGTAANRFGTGGSFLSSANSGANANSSTGLNALTGLTGQQSDRAMNSLGMLPNISQTGTNQANVYGNLGLNSNRQNIDAMDLGNNMFNSGQGSQISGINSQNNLIGTQGNYALGAGNLANQGSNDISSIIQAIMGGNFTASGQGLNRTNSMFNTQNQGNTAQGNMLNFAGQQQQSSTNDLMKLLQQMFPFMQGNSTAANNTAFDNANPATNPWGPAISDTMTSVLKAAGLGT